MCFSAEASFTGAAIISAVGVATVYLARKNLKLILLALTPFLFAVQQSAEGFVWLNLRGDHPFVPLQLATATFLTFAYGVWPIYVPLALLLPEKTPWRRYVMGITAFFGAAVVATTFYNLDITEVVPKVVGNSIQYIEEQVIGLKLAYLVAVTMAFFLSSLPHIWVFGAVAALSFLFSYLIFFATFSSVWCFFGAIFSVILYWVVRDAVKEGS